MASKVQMANAALTKVGGNLILSLTEGTAAARACNTRFDDILYSLLQDHPWNFAVERATLVPLTAAPNHEYDYKFLLPTNPYCLKVLDVYLEVPYKVEGRYILCNESSIDIKYIKRITDVNELSPMFRELFSLKLAADLAYSEAGSVNLKQQLLEEFNRLLREARSIDAQEDTPDEFRKGSWTRNRGRGSSRHVVARQY